MLGGEETRKQAIDAGAAGVRTANARFSLPNSPLNIAIYPFSFRPQQRLRLFVGTARKRQTENTKCQRLASPCGVTDLRAGKTFKYHDGRTRF